MISCGLELHENPKSHLRRLLPARREARSAGRVQDAGGRDTGVHTSVVGVVQRRIRNGSCTHELVLTTKEYMREVTAVEPEVMAGRGRRRRFSKVADPEYD